MSRTWMVAVALLVTLGLAWGASGESQAGNGKVLGRMPAWKLAAPDGKVLSSADLKGKVLIVDFWASWCPPCKKEIPGFIALQKQYGAKGLQVVGFSLDRTPEDHSAWIRANGVNYPSLFANTPEGQKVVASFEKVIGPIEGIPTTVVVDRSGQIVFSHVGYGSKEDFEKVVLPLLK